MSEFRIGRKVIDQIHIDSTAKRDGKQRSVALTLAGWNSTPPQISAGSNSFVQIADVSHNTKTRTSSFRIRPKEDAVGIAFVFDATNEEDTVLRVAVGEVTNHRGFQSDLIASELGRSEDGMKLHVY